MGIEEDLQKTWAEMDGKVAKDEAPETKRDPSDNSDQGISIFSMLKEIITQNGGGSREDMRMMASCEATIKTLSMVIGAHNEKERVIVVSSIISSFLDEFRRSETVPIEVKASFAANMVSKVDKLIGSIPEEAMRELIDEVEKVAKDRGVKP